MHKTTRIHIGKTPYNIELDAEAALKRYLAELRAALGTNAAKDTMADIELHITEILAGRNVQSDGVISLDDVRAIKEQLGDPEQVKESQEEGATSKRSGKRFLWIGLVGVALVLLGIAVSVWDDRLFPRKVTNTTEQQTYERPITSLKLEIESGDVTIRSGQAGKVSVERHFKWAGKKPTFTEVWNGEQLRITNDCPENQRNCSLGYVIYVPETVAVDIRADVGNIEISDMTGELRLATSSGNVEVTEAQGIVWSRVSDGNIAVAGQSARVDLQTSSGNIDLRFNTAPMQVAAKTSAGNIDVVVPFGDAYAVRADTSSGRRTVSVQQESTAQRRIDAQVSSGNVTVQYPQN